MKRVELAHILRAASRITDTTDIVIVGSQSILGSFDEDDLPDEAVGSIEADVAFLGDGSAEKALAVDGAIGEDSGFHQMYGYYGQGVEIDGLIVLLEGWQNRIVRWESRSSEPARALCLDPHDLAISKLVAYREKDQEFVHAMTEAGLLNPPLLLERLAATDVPQPHARRIASWVQGMAERVTR
ncbi:DUF6036 family nucleotidyltransferase [Cellulomonas xiejunii]|uniref:DUF6036 domain-containing protein n=1 Tax=Cellulomonas xiejunii TaxID=2968083 RepID=A0ABY5KRB3_9CELL|nr:DUF6036 family nucleotidyltransferase [Cellulomonas xiejunii]MCC2322226.1 hypothetical protein [Cellulomonas xiejunii]UUI72279.1 hypothetical protein NP048_02080 [Cellulomonas xiejunii]